MDEFLKAQAQIFNLSIFEIFDIAAGPEACYIKQDLKILTR